MKVVIRWAKGLAGLLSSKFQTMPPKPPERDCLTTQQFIYLLLIDNRYTTMIIILIIPIVLVFKD